MKEYNFEIEIHPEIKFDLQEGVDYYNSKQDDLGNRFYWNARRKMDSLITDALLYSVKYENIYCVKVPSFPYLIHYRVELNNNTVYIDAVISTNKSPDLNWGKRK